MTGSTEAMKHEGAAAPDCGPAGMRDRAKRLLCGPPPGPERRLWWFGVGHGLAAAGSGFCLGLLMWVLPLWSHPVSREDFIAGQVLVTAGLLACFCMGAAFAVWRLKASGVRYRLWGRCILTLGGGVMAAGACAMGAMFASMALAMGISVRFGEVWGVLQSGLLLLLCLAGAAQVCLLSGAMGVETARQFREPGR